MIENTAKIKPGMAEKVKTANRETYVFRAAGIDLDVTFQQPKDALYYFPYAYGINYNAIQSFISQNA